MARAASRSPSRSRYATRAAGHCPCPRLSAAWGHGQRPHFDMMRSLPPMASPPDRWGPGRFVADPATTISSVLDPTARSPPHRGTALEIFPGHNPSDRRSATSSASTRTQWAQMLG